METYRSPAKKIRKFIKKIIKFIKKKCLEEFQPILLIQVLPSTSFTLTFSKPTLIDVSPEVSHTTDMFTPCTPTYHSQSLHANIPQLDGCSPDIPSPVQCADCYSEFENEEELKSHDESHPFGCEDCNLCFTTLHLWFLHEIAKHPD